MGDCSDGSDEQNCPVSSAKPQPSPTESYCPYWKFRCNNGQCINQYQKCNGHTDCYDGSDEWNCATTPKPSTSYCPYWKFRCNNGQCIYKYQQCNGYANCYDGSDEWNCHEKK